MYRVEWLSPAVDELAAIWVEEDSTLRAAITQATRMIDDELLNDPLRASESREADTRVMFAYPLGVQFDVDQRNRRVRVLHVWRFRRRQRD